MMELMKKTNLPDTDTKYKHSVNHCGRTFELRFELYKLHIYKPLVISCSNDFLGGLNKE